MLSRVKVWMEITWWSLTKRHYSSSQPDIFSVKVAITNGTRDIFKETKNGLKLKGCTKFKMHLPKRLCYLINMEDNRNRDDFYHGIHTWHLILKRCNCDDEVNGMKIKGRDTSNKDRKISTKGKFSLSRNRQLDTHVISILQLVHRVLARPIELSDLDRNRYTVSFTDDFSGAMFLYFTKNKGDLGGVSHGKNYRGFFSLRQNKITEIGQWLRVKVKRFSTRPLV